MSETQTHDERAAAPAYWAVIPAGVRYDDRIPAAAKLLYAEISSLTGSAGYCWADNAYFAQLYRITERSVRRLLDALADQGYIRVEEKRGERNVVLWRRIYAGVNPLSEKTDSGDEISLDKNVQTEGLTGVSLDKNIRSLDKNVQTHIIKEQEILTHGRATSRDVCAPSWNPERFERFWTYYRSIPGADGRRRSENRQAAVAAWDKLRPSDQLIGEIGRALLRQLETDEWSRGIGIPRAATYLNQRRWEDAADLPDPETADSRPAERGKDVVWV